MGFMSEISEEVGREEFREVLLQNIHTLPVDSEYDLDGALLNEYLNKKDVINLIERTWK